MQQQKMNLAQIILVGQTVRTNNKNEMIPEKSRIAKLAHSWWSNNMAQNILHRVKPGVTYSVYTDYESDQHGDYTYFIGEAVESLDNQDLSTFDTATIPMSAYQKFTTEVGQMPDIVISAWQKIWTMTDTDFGGKRKYIADFEIYNEKAADPNNAIVDIYIGVED